MKWMDFCVQVGKEYMYNGMVVPSKAEFVIEADSAYPDKRCTRNPRWAKELFAPINRLADESYKAGDDFACINSLSDLRQYL